MSRFIYILLVLFPIFMKSQVYENREYKSVQNLSVSNGINVILEESSENTMKVETDNSEYLSYIKTDFSENGTLRIYIGAKNKKLKIKYKAINVYIKSSGIKNFDISSGANIKINNNFTVNDFNLESSSGSNFSGNISTKYAKISSSSGSNVNINISASNIDLTASSGSNLNLSGSSENIKIESSSAARINTEKLISKNVDIQSSSASSANVYASERLNASASSASTIKYLGNPKEVKVKTNSVGRIIEKK